MKMQTMKTLVASITLAVAAALARPRSIKEIMKTPVNDLTPEERVLRTEHMKETKLRIFGEDVVKPGSQKGKIVFVNAQGWLPEAEIESAVAMIRKCAKFNLAVQTGGGEKPALDRAAGACAEYGANVALVVADATTPAMLVAPEDRWAVVNVQRLAEGFPPGAFHDRMFAARCRKEIVRFSLSHEVHETLIRPLQAALRRALPRHLRRAATVGVGGRLDLWHDEPAHEGDEARRPECGLVPLRNARRLPGELHPARDRPAKPLRTSLPPFRLPLFAPQGPAARIPVQTAERMAKGPAENPDRPAASLSGRRDLPPAAADVPACV